MTNPPKTWLTESILVTLLCCLPLGIAAIIQSNKVSTFIATEKAEEAQKASETAKTYVLVSAGLGVACYFIIFMLSFLGALAG